MRNSPVAVAHLLNQVGVDHILVGREQPALDLLNASLECLSTTSSYPDLPSQSILPIFDDIYLRHDSRDYESKAHKLVYQYEGPDSPGMILHSSGTLSLETASISAYAVCKHQDRLHSLSLSYSQIIVLYSQLQFRAMLSLIVPKKSWLFTCVLCSTQWAS